MPDRILTSHAVSLHGMRITAQPAGGLTRQQIFPLSTSQLPQTVFTGIAYRAPHTRIGALPARIANRIGRFRWIPGAASTYHVAGSYTRTGSDPCSGLDLSAPMFAPCLLVRPGTGRQDTVLTSLRLAGLRHSCARHSIPVTQVFKKCL